MASIRRRAQADAWSFQRVLFRELVTMNPPRREQAAIPPCTGCGGGQTSSVHLTSNRTKSRSNVTIAAPCFDGQRRDVGVPCGDIQP